MTIQLGQSNRNANIPRTYSSSAAQQMALFLRNIRYLSSAQIACSPIVLRTYAASAHFDIKHWHFCQRIHRKNEEASDEFSLEFPNKIGKHIPNAMVSRPQPRHHRRGNIGQSTNFAANNHNHQDRLLQTPNTNTRNRNPFKFRSQLTNCSISCVGEYP